MEVEEMLPPHKCYTLWKKILNVLKSLFDMV